jgi:hypothetical protein
VNDKTLDNLDRDIATEMKRAFGEPQVQPQPRPEPSKLTLSQAKTMVTTADQLISMARAGFDDIQVKLRNIRNEHQRAKLTLVQQSRDEIDRIEGRTKHAIAKMEEDYLNTLRQLEQQMETYSRIIQVDP